MSEQTNPTAEENDSLVEAATETVSETVSEAADAVTETVEAVAETVSETVADATEAVVETAGAAAEAVSETATEAVAAVAETAAAVAATTTSGAKSIIDAVVSDDDDSDDSDDDDDDDDGDDDDEYREIEVDGPQSYTPQEYRGRVRRVGNDVRVESINYKNVALLTRFLDPRGRILSRRKTRVSAKVQRNVVREIKRARHLALLPYTADQTRIVRKRRR